MTIRVAFILSRLAVTIAWVWLPPGAAWQADRGVDMSQDGLARDTQLLLRNNRELGPNLHASRFCAAAGARGGRRLVA